MKSYQTILFAGSRAFITLMGRDFTAKDYSEAKAKYYAVIREEQTRAEAYQRLAKNKRLFFQLREITTETNSNFITSFKVLCETSKKANI